MVITGGFIFCNMNLKAVQFYNLFNSNQIILVLSVNCCPYYMNIVRDTIQASIPYIFRLIYSN